MNKPRFLIDDTSELGEARVFVVHTQEPRFVGELFCEDEDGTSDAPINGVTIAVSETEVLAAIEWIDPPTFDAHELIPALQDALKFHWLSRRT